MSEPEERKKTAKYMLNLRTQHLPFMLVEMLLSIITIYEILKTVYIVFSKQEYTNY